MEQMNRIENAEISSHLISRKVSKTYIGKKAASSTNGAGKTGYLFEKSEARFLSHPVPKTNHPNKKTPPKTPSQWIQLWNSRPHTYSTTLNHAPTSVPKTLT
jgi:hypothetical protein